MLKVTHLFLIFLSFSIGICIDYDGWLNIKLEHTLNCKEHKYCHRGNILLKSIRLGTPIIDQINFSKEDIAALEKLALEDEFYSIKSIVTSADNKEMIFLSSMKARAFLDTDLSDVISAWVLPNGAVISVGFQASNSTEMLSRENKSPLKINSNFYLRHVEQAPVPDTASYIQKLEREKEARERGELKDNRSFLAKYWMYIVPIGIFIMISGATNPEQGGQATRQ